MDNTKIELHRQIESAGFNLLRYINEPTTHTTRNPRSILFIRESGSPVTLENIGSVFDSCCKTISDVNTKESRGLRLVNEIYQAVSEKQSVLIEIVAPPSVMLMRILTSLSRSGVLELPIGFSSMSHIGKRQVAIPAEITIAVVIDRGMQEANLFDTNFYTLFDLITVVKGGNP